MVELKLIVPKNESEIKVEVDALREQIAERQAVIKAQQAEIKMLACGVQHYQGFCSHTGRKSGYNSRDGGWAEPCKICGHSY